jgi:ketosteroid isomerase-like protein/plastocyanin
MFQPVLDSLTLSLSRRRSITRLGGALLLFAGALRTPQQTVRAQATPSPDDVEATARHAIEAVNTALDSGDAGVLDAVFAPDVAAHPPHRSLITSQTFSHDLDGLKAGLMDIRRYVADATIAIDDLIAEDAMVAARVTFRGTLDAAALGLGERTGGPMEIGGLLYGRVEDGRIAEFWAYFDPAAYIGLVDRRPVAAEATPQASTSHGHGHDPAAPTDPVDPDAEEVAVTLTEFNIALASPALHAGRPYAFVVTNAGTVTHELVIERPGATHKPLAAGDRVAMIEDIAPGESRTLGWTFDEPGTYQLACHEPGHYEAGQVVVVDVEG